MRKRVKRSTILLLTAVAIGSAVMLAACGNDISKNSLKMAAMPMEDLTASDSTGDVSACAAEPEQSGALYSLEAVAKEQFLLDCGECDEENASRSHSRRYVYENDSGAYYAFESDGRSLWEAEE